MYVTAPLPTPALLPVIFIQFTLLVACHAHCPDAVTFIVPAPPLAEKSANRGEIEFVQASLRPPFWITEKTLPPIIKAPARGFPVKFSLTSKVTAPFPLPAFEDVMTIQLSALVADQGQFKVVFKLTLPDPPLA